METEDRPYIEPPDEKDDDVRNGLICWLHPERECGPDCMAFTTAPAESPVLNDQQKNCAAIVSLERMGRFGGLLVQILKRYFQDSQRADQPPPQKPFGG